MINKFIDEIEVSRETKRFKTTSMIKATDLISVDCLNLYRTSNSLTEFQMLKTPI